MKPFQTGINWTWTADKNQSERWQWKEHQTYLSRRRYLAVLYGPRWRPAQVPSICKSNHIPAPNHPETPRTEDNISPYHHHVNKVQLDNVGTTGTNSFWGAGSIKRRLCSNWQEILSKKSNPKKPNKKVTALKTAVDLRLNRIHLKKVWLAGNCR